MPRYRYQAKSLSGKMVNGELDAVDDADARTKIRTLQLIPVRIGVAGEGGRSRPVQPSFFENLFGKKVTSKEIQVFIRQFATLINSGITVVDALNIIGSGSSAPGLRVAVMKVKSSIEGGRGLADSMQMHPLIFDSLFCNMVRAGESSGSLDLILGRVAGYVEKSEKLKNQIKGAFYYPMAIIFVSIIVISGILIFIIPKFQDLYKNSKQEPPALTQLVVSLSEAFAHNWILVVIALLMIPIGFNSYYNTLKGRRHLDQIFIELPIFGDLVLKSAIARFSRTLATLLSSGIPLIEAIETSAKTSGNWVIERTLLACKESVTVGKSFAQPLSRQKYIPDMVTKMVAIGEQTGSIDTMLAKVADYYEDEVDNSVKGIVSLIEPILMVVLGGIIAFLVVAMYLPIFNMAGTVGG